ncbi:hypothetical protein [Candidatus Neptunichlamydia sp. REUL1]|uniref:hypothetical protein n=1 Tax=Candidatus Neptunichlamydia sp. REUL1 TaxID=3064277 RepID=UPI00292DCBF8|nr:hypothetical protein [Candidatus Neptunochlamydia sp. REUL1]
MIEKVKRNWKRILFIGGGAYVAIAILSTVVGGVLIKGRMDKMENCEDEIGKAFIERKAEFRERFDKNWNAKLDRLSEGFARSQKASDKHQIKGMKGSLEDNKKYIKDLIREGNNQDRVKRLESQLPKRMEHIEIIQAAFDKKWTPQAEDETLNQFERRRDEGKIDWLVIQLSRRVDSLEWYPDQRESALENIERQKDLLHKEQAKFQEKYSEPYRGTELKDLCFALQEQSRKDPQAFLENLSVK